jgi:CRISPR-associated protein Cmr5
MATRSQRHAQAIYRQVDQVSQMAENLKKGYGSLCHRFPVMVLRSGLAQAVGFLHAKAGGDGDRAAAYGLLLTHLASHLHNKADARIFQNHVHQASLAEYRRLTREALAASVWYKRYAQSLLGVDASDDGDRQ